MPTTSALVSKTPRTRRKQRSHPSTKSRNEVDDNFNDKENWSHNSSRGTTKSPIVKKRGNRSKQSEESARHSSLGDLFHQCLPEIAHVDGFWNDDSELLECIAEASLSEDEPTMALHLSLKEKTPQLLSGSRRLIKEATNIQKGDIDAKNTSSLFGCLFVACHVLRCIRPWSNDIVDMKDTETAIRLLHHLLQITADATKNGSSDLRLLTILISSYDAMGHFVRQYSCPSPCKDKRIQFEYFQGERIVVPSWNNTKGNRILGTMMLRQISSIYIKAIQAFIVTIDHLWHTSGKHQSKYWTDVRRFAPLCGTFCTSIVSLIENSMDLPSPQLQNVELLRNAYMTWTLCLLDSKDEECLKDASSHCRLGHRILWDVASKIKSSHLPQPQKNQTSLNMRMHAIILMLPLTNDQNKIAMINFTGACSYAWKAASAYAQSVSSSTIPGEAQFLLTTYHDQIGKVLDCTAIKLSSSRLPLSYVEYSAHRILQANILPPIDLLDQNRSNGSFFQVFLNVIVLVAIVRKRLEGEAIENIDLVGCIKEKIPAFGRTLVEGLNMLEPEEFSRSAKVLTMFSLHRSIYIATRNEHSSRDEESLHLAGIISTKCIAPYLSSVLEKAPASLTDPQLFETIVECYIRPLSAFETLSSEYLQRKKCDLGNNLAKMCDKTIEELHDFVSRTQDTGRWPSSSLLVKCAKSVSIVGRQRMENSRNGESITPLLHSIALYHDASTEACDDNNYHLSTRLNQLANVYQKMGKLEESCLLLAAVISIETAMNSSTNTKEPELECVDALAARSKSVLSPIQERDDMSVLLKSTIRRLFSIFPLSVVDSATESMSTGSCLDLHDILGMLLESERIGNSVFQMVAGQLGRRVSLNSLLCAVLRPHNMTMTNKKMLCNHLITFAEFIIELGDQISRITAEERTEEVADLISAHNNFVGCAEFAITRHFDGEPLVKLILASLLKLVSSTSLLPMRNFAEDTIYGTTFRTSSDAVTKRILHLASECVLGIRAVNSSEIKKSWDGISEAIRLAVSQYSLFLNLAESSKEYPTFDMLQLFSLCEDTADIALRSNSAQPETKKWIKWNLFTMKSRLDLEGDHIRAARLAFLGFALADNSEVAEMEWMASVFIESYLKIPMMQRQFALSIDSEVDASTVSTDQEPLDQLASQAVRLSLSMLDGCNDECTIIDQMHCMQNLENQKEVSLLSDWVLSSMAFARARLAHQSGNLMLALKQIQECATHCQRILAETRRYSPTKGAGSPFWFQVARMTLFVQARQRYSDCLLTKSQLFIRLGDHRKAWSCVLSVPRVLGVDIAVQKRSDRTIVLHNTISSLISTKPLILRQFNRIRLVVNCLFSPSDLVVTQFKRFSPEKIMSEQQGFMDEAIQDLISAGDVLYGSEMTARQRSDFKAYYEHLSQYQLSPMPLIYSNLKLPMNIEVATSRAYRSKLSLSKARCLLHETTEMDEVTIKRIESLCFDVINDPTSFSIDKSWANYYVGLLALDTTRRNGDLARLWYDQGAVASETLTIARQRFLSALSRIDDNDNNVFYRTLIRSLALVSGPENGELSGSIAGMLVLTSIGSGGRRQMLRSLDGRQGADDLLRAFSCFDTRLGNDSGRDHAINDFLCALEALTPKNWHFVAATICPTGELLLTSLDKGTSDTTFRVETRCIFPDGEKYSAYDDILRPLDEIIGKSQQHLKGMVPDQVLTNYTKESAKRNWWSIRNQLDEALCHHIHEVEERYFLTIHHAINSMDSNFEENDTGYLPCGNLASRFEAAYDSSVPEDTDEIDEESLWKLTVPKLKNILRQHSFTDSQMRRMRKHEVIGKIVESQEKHKQEEFVTASTNDGNRSCLFLLLDENLQRFPFEGMESLEGKQVFRIPSLPFVYATLQERIKPNQHGISLDPSNATFVLDPESNLESTRKRLLPILEGVSSSRGWDWDGVIGRPPTSSFFENALMKKNGLVIFIGHGGAQTCYSRRDVEQMIRGEGHETFRTCNSSLILMGCSSGRLVSVNQKGSKSFDEQPLFFDPEGIALSYLCAGAPCVVGNLWDVTDHDIDRFSIALFQKFFGESNIDEIRSLGDCVAESRSSCKLRYIVGCAPVCYGVPVFCN